MKPVTVMSALHLSQLIPRHERLIEENERPPDTCGRTLHSHALPVLHLLPPTARTPDPITPTTSYTLPTPSKRRTPHMLVTLHRRSLSGSRCGESVLNHRWLTHQLELLHHLLLILNLNHILTR